MARVFLQSLSIVLVMLVFGYRSSSTAHIIGGSINTRNYSIVGRNVIKPVLSNCNIARPDSQESNSITEDNYSVLPEGEESQFVRVQVPASALSGMNHVFPFFRRKRQACNMQNLRDLNMTQLLSTLDSQLLVGHLYQNLPEVTVSPTEPTDCPNNLDLLMGSKAERLRSTCPWKLERRYLGEKAIPRYAIEAKCLCSRCIDNPLNICTPLRNNVTYFELQGCQGDLALLKKKITSLVVGCTCLNPVHGQ